MDNKQSIVQSLTNKELEICRLIADGCNSSRIAQLLYLSEGTVKNYITSIYGKTGARNRAQLAARYTQEYEQALTDISEPTEHVDTYYADAKLRLAGVHSLYNLPDVIKIRFQGKPFVIGRFDVSIGHKKCDFEFPKETKAVSRSHASIEQTDREYVIKDLNSSVGTFINGNKINPGEQYPIKHGDLISFGNAGAEYVFECH